MKILNKNELYKNAIAAGEGALLNNKLKNKRPIIQKPQPEDLSEEILNSTSNNVFDAQKKIALKDIYKGNSSTNTNVFTGQRSSNTLLKNDLKGGGVNI